MENAMFNLKQEKRCGHLVTEQVKKLWQVEMDLSDQLAYICKKYGLRYFAGGGTLLGAVRHRGFIPWDDDMDFFMPYEDYCKLQEVAPKELKYPYAFQDYHNTRDCGPMFSRIRKSDTTGCTKVELNVVPPHNLGIFIDIFPLFDAPESEIARKMQLLRIKFFGTALIGHNIVLRKKHKNTMCLKDHFYPKVLLWRFMSLFMDHEGLCKAYLAACQHRLSQYYGITSFIPGKEKYIWEKAWFNDTVELPFEDRMLPCPKDYEQVLTHQYGDWTKMVKGGAIHSVGIIDPDTPYWVTFKDLFCEMHEKEEHKMS